ncbi:MAG: amylo-alpha-1,6-glucosidase [Terriglobia bacterium]
MTIGAKRPYRVTLLLSAALSLVLSNLGLAQERPAPVPLEPLKNFIHYRSGPTCFKDLASHFGVFWADQIYSFPNSHSSVDPSEVEFLTHGWGQKVVNRPIESLGVGPQLVTALYGDDSIVFTPALLNARVTIIDDKPVAPIGAIHRDDYPYGVAESQAYPVRVTVTATTVFADLDTLVIRYAVQNDDRQAHTIQLELLGATSNDALEKKIKYDSELGLLARYHTPFAVWIEENLEWNSPAVYLGPPDRQVDIYWSLRSSPRPASVRIEDTAEPQGVPETSVRELKSGAVGALRYVEKFDPITVPSRASTQIVATAGFSFEKPDSAVYRAEKALSEGRKESVRESIGAAQSRWAQILESLPPLPAHYARYQRLYQHAAMTLVMDEYQGRGRWLGNRTSTYVARSVLPAMGFWDTCFTSVGMREIDTKKAEDLIHVLIDHPLPSSLVPSIMSEEVRTGDGQAPILSWAAWRIYQATEDKSFLESVYPACARLDRFWFESQDRNHDGLPEWRNGGQIGDNSPRWDKGGKVRTNLNMGEFESPDLAGFLLMDQRCLARMAQALGKAEEAKAWEENAAALGRNLVAKMYFSSDNAFWDLDINTGEPWTRIVTPNMFIPLWAGVPLSPPQVDGVIRAHMLNPMEMNGAVPFPSVAYNDRSYDPLAYWRGIMWPHFVYWMVESLQKNGHPEDAQRVADSLLEILARSEYLHECYESKSGKPAGIPEYSWTGAATLELLLERWKDPL